MSSPMGTVCEQDSDGKQTRLSSRMYSLQETLRYGGISFLPIWIPIHPTLHLPHLAFFHRIEYAIQMALVPTLDHLRGRGFGWTILNAWSNIFSSSTIMRPQTYANLSSYSA